MICFKVKSFANIRRKEQDSFEKAEHIDVLFPGYVSLPGFAQCFARGFYGKQIIFLV